MNSNQSIQTYRPATEIEDEIVTAIEAGGVEDARVQYDIRGILEDAFEWGRNVDAPTLGWRQVAHGQAYDEIVSAHRRGNVIERLDS